MQRATTSIYMFFFPFSPSIVSIWRSALHFDNSKNVEVSLPCQFHSDLIQLKCNSIALSIKVESSVVRFQARYEIEFSLDGVLACGELIPSPRLCVALE